jgi:methylmalonyl-CoA/ethylmalonyl-CoA epimerase
VADGLRVKMRGRRSNASGFTYFDTADQAGGVTLLVRATPAGSRT